MVSLPSVASVVGDGGIDYEAPNFDVLIGDLELGVNVSKFVEALEYESADGIADEARMTLINPDFLLSDSTLWQPGNTMELYFGYGPTVQPVGQVIITKVNLTYPRSGMPKIEVVGHTQDFLLMQNRPPRTDAKNRGIDENLLIHEMVRNVANRDAYQFDKLDIDDTPGRYVSPQKVDISDYEYVDSMANVMGYLFWVDFKKDEGWTFHFKDPTVVTLAQEKSYTFEYGAGDKSTLLDFQPEMALSGAITKLQVQGRILGTDKEPPQTILEEFNDNEDVPNLVYRGDASETIGESHTTGGAVMKLFFGDYAVEVVSDRKFASTNEAKVWAQMWWRKRRENFILGRGTTIGVPSVMARQVHELKLPDIGLSGDYYFARVRHVFSPTSGYLMDFTARKVIK